jgi:molecular chaperone GrpE
MNSSILVKSQFKNYKKYSLQLQADFENYKKRIEKEKNKIEEREKARLLKEILPVLDELEIGSVHLKEMKMIAQNLEKTLEKEGLREIEVKQFNPEKHEVVQAEKNGKKMELVRKGYEIEGILIRPALVKIV